MKRSLTRRARWRVAVLAAGVVLWGALAGCDGLGLSSININIPLGLSGGDGLFNLSPGGGGVTTPDNGPPGESPFPPGVVIEPPGGTPGSPPV